MKILQEGVYIGIGLVALLLIALDEVWQRIRMGVWWVMITLWEWGAIVWFSTGGEVLYRRRRRRAMREIERIVRDGTGYGNDGD